MEREGGLSVIIFETLIKWSILWFQFEVRRQRWEELDVYKGIHRNYSSALSGRTISAISIGILEISAYLFKVIRCQENKNSSFSIGNLS